MCCFSRPVESVTETKIFARSHPDGREIVVYAMKLSVKEDVAMILPLPVKPGAGEKALEFVNLEGCPRFFSGLSELFDSLNAPASDPFASGGESRGTLEVQQVGAYEASFVPRAADFSRLDERFRLPAGAWDKLPQYSDWGFAVFKLRKGAVEVHPMAFAFPRRDPAKLFFPTVHIHDGEVHQEADFDHVLYCQRLPEEKFSVKDWDESPELPHTSLDLVAARGIVHPQHHVYRRLMNGKLNNADVVLV